jgi:CheY-like chemotaxis protein
MNDPALNGVQALQTLKQDQELKRIPVLAFANHEEVDTWRKAKELDIDKIVSRNEFSSRTLALLEEVTHQASS